MIRILPSVLLLAAACILGACESHYSPKPKAYPRVHFPERANFQHFQAEYCPFNFMVPDYFRISSKSEFFGSQVEHPCWGYNLDIPALNGTIYLTYKELGPGQDLFKLTEDAYKLTFKHARKADYIEPLDIRTENDVFGLIYYVGGDAASQIQFFATDTVNHFLRGTLNFRTQPNADSLAPVVQFISQDLEQMLGSLTWE